MTGPVVRTDGSSGLGRDYDRRLDRMNIPQLDKRERGALRCASDSLVRAQLKAGQHVLPFGQAMVAAGAIGLAKHFVRPGIGARAAGSLAQLLVDVREPNDG